MQREERKLSHDKSGLPLDSFAILPHVKKIFATRRAEHLVTLSATKSVSATGTLYDFWLRTVIKNAKVDDLIECRCVRVGNERAISGLI